MSVHQGRRTVPSSSDKNSNLRKTKSAKSSDRLKYRPAQAARQLVDGKCIPAAQAIATLPGDRRLRGRISMRWMRYLHRAGGTFRFITAESLL
ncbi:hypothetical protein ACVINW_007130 [Bradyrhizobium sp. USDA 4461]